MTPNRFSTRILAALKGFPGLNEVTFAASRLRLERDCNPMQFAVSRKRLLTTPSSASEGTGGPYQTTNSTYGAAIVIAALSLGSIPAIAQDVPANEQAVESASDPSGQIPDLEFEEIGMAVTAYLRNPANLECLVFRP